MNYRPYFPNLLSLWGIKDYRTVLTMLLDGLGYRVNLVTFCVDLYAELCDKLGEEEGRARAMQELEILAAEVAKREGVEVNADATTTIIKDLLEQWKSQEYNEVTSDLMVMYNHILVTFTSALLMFGSEPAMLYCGMLAGTLSRLEQENANERSRV